MHSILPQSVCYLEVTDLAIKRNCDNAPIEVLVVVSVDLGMCNDDVECRKY